MQNTLLTRERICCGICLILLFLFRYRDCPAQQDEPRIREAAWIPGETIRLTFDGRLKHDPVYVSESRSIAYTSLEKFNQLCLMKLDLEEKKPSPLSRPMRLHPAANTSELMVSFARDPSQYAFLRNNGNLHFEVVIENLKTGKTVTYNPGGGFAGVRSISFHPSGSQVVFPFPDQNGPQQIKSLSADGKTVVALTDSEGINRCPRFSDDGNKIVFSSSRDGDFDVFLMNSDGSQQVNVLRSPGLDTHPVLSPDSTEIAFTSLRDGNYDIYVIRTDGSDLRRVTKNSETDDYPGWTPDGKSLFWIAERKGKRDLYFKTIH